MNLYRHPCSRSSQPIRLRQLGLTTQSLGRGRSVKVDWRRRSRREAAQGNDLQLASLPLSWRSGMFCNMSVEIHTRSECRPGYLGPPFDSFCGTGPYRSLRGSGRLEDGNRWRHGKRVSIRLLCQLHLIATGSHRLQSHWRAMT